jgi:hypothetical protein
MYRKIGTILLVFGALCFSTSSAKAASSAIGLYLVTTEEKTLSDRLRSIPVFGRVLKTQFNGQLLYLSQQGDKVSIWFLGKQRDALKSDLGYRFHLNNSKLLLNLDSLLLEEKTENHRRTYLLKSLALPLSDTRNLEGKEGNDNSNLQEAISDLTGQVRIISDELEKKNKIISDLRDKNTAHEATIVFIETIKKDLEKAVSYGEGLEQEIVRLKSKEDMLSTGETELNLPDSDIEKLKKKILELEEELKSARVTIKVLGNIKNH